MRNHATVEPEYEIARGLADIQVSQHAAYTVAEVVVTGPAGDAGSQAFPILSGYFSGENKGERKFAMTESVAQADVPMKMEMTTPVIQAAAPGGFLVQFVLPSDVTVANAPEPLDVRVQLRDVLPSLVAVIRYSGLWSESNYNEHLAKLQTSLRAADLSWEGEAVYSSYNSPSTPWFLRRSEIWLNLANNNRTNHRDTMDHPRFFAPPLLQITTSRQPGSRQPGHA